MQKIQGAKELKAYDYTFSGSVYSGSVVLKALTNVGQGTTDSTCIGSRISLSGVRMRFSLGKSNSTSYRGSFRLIVFQNVGDGANIPVSADVLQNTAVGYILVSPYQFQTRKTIKVLYDKVMNIDDDDPIMDVVVTLKKFSTKSIEWFGNPIVNTDVQAQGHLWYMLCTDGNFTITNSLDFDVISRLTFYDS